MTLTLVADEFGLLHAAVPHPCRPKQNIQIMVLQAEDGWWTYVDGERIPGHFQSAQQAGRAAAKAIDNFRSLADTATARDELPDVVSRVPASRKRGRSLATRFHVSRGAIAASVVLAFLAVSVMVIQATDVLKGDALAARDATSTTAQDNVVVSSIESGSSTTGSLNQLQETSSTAARKTAAIDDAAQVPGLQPAPGRKAEIPELPVSNPVSLKLRDHNAPDATATIDSARVEPSSAMTEAVKTNDAQQAGDTAADGELTDLATEGVAPASRNLETDLEDVDSLASSREAASLRATDYDQTSEGAEALGLPASASGYSAAQRERAALRRANRRAKIRRARALAARKRRASRRRTAAIRASHHRRVRRSKPRLQGRALRRAIRKQRNKKFRRAYRAAFGKN